MPLTQNREHRKVAHLRPAAAGWLLALALVAVAAIPVSGWAQAVSVIAGTNGVNLPADYAANAAGGGTWTNMGSIVISEPSGGLTDFAPNQTGVTLILTAPAGWNFNPGQGSVTVQAGGDIFNASLAVASSTVTLTFSTGGGANADKVTISGVQMKAADGNNIGVTNSVFRTSLNPGTANIVGLTGPSFYDHTILGSVSQTFGAVKNLIVTLPNQNFLANTGNAGTPVNQTAGSLFNISKITAVDQFLNIVTTYAGPKTLSYSGPHNPLCGSAPSYTTSMSFVSGQAGTLGTTLTKAETTTISASDTALGGPTGVASSSLTVVPGAATQVLVETAADGSGGVVGAQSINTTPASPLTAYAVTRDAYCNFIANAASTWSVTGSLTPGDLVPAGDNKSATFTAAHCSGSGTLHVVNGSLSGDSAILTVVDNTPPTANCQPFTAHLSATFPASVTVAATAIDNGSSDNCGITAREISKDGGATYAASVTFGCGDVGVQPVKLRVTDAAANVSVCNASVTVVDDTAPTVTCSPLTITLDNTGNYTLSAGDITALIGSASDNCGLASTNVSQTSFTYCDAPSKNVTVTVTDTHGNPSSCTATVTVNLPAAPSVVYVDASYPATCQAVNWPYTGSGSYFIGFNAFKSVQAAINAVASGGTVNVAAGTYAENVAASKPVTLSGANHGVSGCGTRAPESIISGGTVIAVDVTSDDVTVDGFELTGATGLRDLGHVGVVVQNNLVNASATSSSAVGLDLEGVTTTLSKTLTVEQNCISLGSQLTGSPTAPQTVGVVLLGVSGPQSPVIQDNSVSGAWYGYLLYSLNASVPTVVKGGSITGVMQGVAVLNQFATPPATPVPAASSFTLDSISMSGFAGNYLPAFPALAAFNFHAGVYVYSGGSTTSAKLTGTLTGLSVTGTGKISPDSSGLYFADYSTTAAVMQQMAVDSCSVNTNENRGVFVTGANAAVTVRKTILRGNGFDPYHTGGNDGYGIIARNNSQATVDECFIENPLPGDQVNTVAALSADANTGPLGPTLVVTNCSVVNNGNGKLAVQSAGALNAGGDWWGGTSDTAIAALMSGAVDFTPYLDSGTDTDLATAGFQGDFSTLHVTTLGFQTGATGRIQEGINDVVGGTVLVSAGTYTEGPQIHVYKDVTMVGAATATTIVNPAGNTSNSGDAKGWWLVDSAVTLNLSQMTLDGSGKLVFQAIRSYGLVSVDHVHFTHIKYNASGPDYAGTGVVSFDNGVNAATLNVSNCQFDDIGRISLFYFGNTTGSCSGSTFTGKGTGNFLDYALEIGAGASVTVTGNTITGNEGVASVDNSQSAGVLVESAFGPHSSGKLVGNTITGNTYGVAAGDGDATPSTKVMLQNNDLTGSTAAGLVVGSGATVDAGNCTGSNVTGLGISTGGNNFSGYGFDNAAPWAIDDQNTSGQANVLAEQNNFGAVLGNVLDALVSDQTDNAGLSKVLATQSGGLLVQCPAAVNLQCQSGVPAAASDLAGFEAQFGAASTTVATVTHTDTVVPGPGGPNNETITRHYTLTDPCSQSTSCDQVITVLDTQAPVVTTWPADPTLTVGSLCTVAVPDLTTGVSATDNCGTVHVAQSPLATTLVGPGTYTVVLTVSDDGGNSVTHNATLTVLAGSQPAATFVDDNYVGLTSGTAVKFPYGGAGADHYIGCDAFATIQGGIDRVAAAGTVNVAPGTYPEVVRVNKGLTLLGAQAGQSATTRFAAFTPGANGPKADPSVESIITAAATDPGNAANDSVHVMADNVTIDGFVVDGNNAALAQGSAVVVGGINTDSRRAIETENASGILVGANSALVRNNVIQNFAQRGIELANPADTSPPTSGSVISGNVVRNFGWDGILIAFNAYSDVTGNTVDMPAGGEAGIWLQDFPGSGATPKTLDWSHNTVTVCQDAIGGIWANLFYASAATLNIHDNTVNAAAGVTGSDDLTFGIYLSTLQGGATAQLANNTVGASGGQFARGIALWNLPTTTTTTVTGGSVGNALKGVSLHYTDPNFGGAGASFAASVSGVSITGTVVGVLVDATGSGSDTVQMEISGNTSVQGCTTGISVLDSKASARIHDNSASITGNAVGIDVSGGKALIQNNNLTGNTAAGVRVENGATVDAGACGVVNYTGLGTSTGGNNLTGYGFDDAAPWAIQNLNASSDPAVYAQNNNFGAGGPNSDIRLVLFDVKDDNTRSVVHASDSTAALTCPPSPSPVQCVSGLQTAATDVDSFYVLGGAASATEGTVTHSDDPSSPGPNNGTVNRHYTLTDACSQTASCVQGLPVLDTTQPSVVCQPVTRTLSGVATTVTITPADVFVSGTDNCGGPVTPTTVVPDTFCFAGTFPVTLTATDGNGNLGTCVTTVTVTDSRPTPTVVYVDDSYVGLPSCTPVSFPYPGSPGGPYLIGYNAFATIQAGVNAVAANGTVNVAAGTYAEDVTIGKTISVLGAGAGSSVVVGPIGGPGSTFALAASGIVLDGFTITRDGNTVAQWNDPNLNSAGVSISGAGVNCTVQNCLLTANRTGIDVNNSSGNTIRNNVIVDNRTGLIFRNVTDNLTVVENAITNNWTVGIVFLDASSGSNVPLQTALNCNFSNNNVSGNWYGQIVDRQTGGSLPAPGANPKNFSGNWLGTTTPVVTIANSTEPGYSAQIPVEFGGVAVPPGGQPDIAGPASANFDYTPFLDTGTDTDISTGFGTVGFQGDLHTLHVVSTGAQTGSSGRIQEGIKLVSGSTVLIGPGAYTENDLVNKKVVLVGSGSGANPAIDTIITSALANTPTVTITAGGANTGDRLILRDLRVTGATGAGNSGSGIQLATTGSYFTFDNVASVGNGGNGVAQNLGSGGNQDIIVSGCSFSNNGEAGFRVPTAGSIDGLSVTGSHFDGNVYGLEVFMGNGSGSVFQNVNVSGSSFNNNSSKGIYAEKLSNASFSCLQVIGSGAVGSFGAGININLKFGAYSNIQITDSDIVNCGTGDAVNGGGVVIEARGTGSDSSSYTVNPATLNGVTLSGLNVTGCPDGIRFGEPAKNNLGPTAVTVQNCNLAGNLHDGIRNESQALTAAQLNWWGSVNGPTVASNPAGNGVGVSANVTYSPWLGDGTDTAPATCGFQPNPAPIYCPPTITTCPPSVITSTGPGRTTCDQVAGWAPAAATETCSPSEPVTIKYYLGYVSVSNKGTEIASPYTFPVGVTTVTTEASDTVGNVGTCTFTVSVADTTPPVVTTPAGSLDRILECSDSGGIANALALAPTATDNCTASPAIHLVSDVNTPGTCPQGYTEVRTWNFTDALNNTSLPFVQTITVRDTTAPTFTTFPTNAIVDCSASLDPSNPALGTPTAHDNCDPNPAITHVDVTTPVHAGQTNVVITRTWTATDACGNPTSQTQTITVEDTLPPVITTCPSDQTLLVDSSCTVVMPDYTGLVVASDNCNHFTITQEPPVGQVLGAAAYQVTMTVTDDGGNSVECFFNLSVEDQIPPSITTCPASRTIAADAGCQAIIPNLLPEVVASDNCTVPINLSIYQDPAAGTPVGLGDTVVTIFVVDESDNTNTCPTTITVADQTPPTITGFPGNMTVSCAGDVPPANDSLVTATDNCAGTVTITHDADVITSQTCPNRYTITRTYHATDAHNNSTPQSQIITVDDETAPVITGFPANTTVSCVGGVPPADDNLVTATDNCGGAVTVTHDADVISGQTCAGRFTITRTYHVADACGNSTSQSQTITVDDETPPAITGFPGNTTVSCAGDVPAANDSLVTATDNCGGAVTVTHDADVISSQTCPNRYTITRTYHVADACGNSTSQSQTITVDDETAPSITGFPADQTVSCAGDVPAANDSLVTATDTCGGTVTVTHDADVISNQTCPNRYTITRTYHVADVCGNSASQSQTITVDDETAPTIAGFPGNTTVSCAGDVPAANDSLVTATDNCGGAVTVTHDADVISSQSCPNRYTITRTYHVADACGNSTSQSHTITVNDQTAPVITGFPANATVSCVGGVPPADDSLVTATDNCGGAVTVTHDADVISGQTCAGRFTITRTYHVADACGNSTSQSQTITVDDETPPTITGFPGNTTVSCAGDVPAANDSLVTASDTCGGAVTVTHDADVISAQTCPNRYTITRTYHVADACGNTASQSQTITVDDETAPTITGFPGNTTVSCAGDVPAANDSLVTATDNCGGTVTVTHDPDVISSQTCPNRYTITRTYHVADACGNSTSQSQTITVDDETAPTITGFPGNTTVSCAGDVPAANDSLVTATDNCGGTVTVTHDADVISNQTCPNRYTITRTYHVADVCGNVITQSQTITVDDETGPVVTGFPGNTTVSCAGDVPAANDSLVTATDNCGGGVTVTHDADVISNQTCPNRYTITRTYHVADVCGNITSPSQTITVDDETAPIATTGSIASCYEQQSDAEAAALAATSFTDNCGGTVTKHASTVLTGCSATISVTGTDACGNTSLPVVYTTRIDNQPPVIGAIVANEVQPNVIGAANVLNCANTSVQGTVTISVVASDNCGLVDGHPSLALANGVNTDTAVFVNENPGGTFNYTWSIGPATADGTWTVTVSASDLCHTVTAPFTLCVNKGQITGQVQLEGFVGIGTVPLHSRVVTFVATTNNPSFGTNVLASWSVLLTNVSGDTFNYTLAGIPNNANGLSAKTAWNLRSKLLVTLDANQQASGVNFTGSKQLHGGDLQGDNIINFLDYSILGNNWFTHNPVADITGDANVSLPDYFILSGNWFTGGDPQ